MRTEKRYLWAILALALLVRLVYVASHSGNPYFDAPILDPAYHLDWARSFAAGETFEKEGAFFRAPLYPWFLGLVLKLSGDSLLAVRIVQALLGTLTVALTYALGRRAFGPREGLLAALFAATYSVLVYFDGELLLPTLVTPLYLLALLETQKLSEPTSRGRVISAGLLWGVATLARPNVLLFAPLLAVWLWKRSSIRAALLLAAGWTAAVAPITIYNYSAGGEFVLVSTQGGVNLWIGNHPGADGHTARVPGTSGDDFEATYREAWALAEGEAGESLTPGQVSRHYGGKATDFWTSSPGEALGLMAKKAAMFFGDEEIGNNQPVRGTIASTAPWLPWISLPVWILMPLALLGFALAARRSELFPLTGFAITFTASVVLFFVCSRFRVPLLPVGMIFAASAILRGVESWSSQRSRVLGLGALVLALAVTLRLTGGDRTLERAEGLSHEAIGFDLADDPSSAAPLHRRAIELAPLEERFVLAFADHLESSGEPDQAIREVRGWLQDRLTLPAVEKELGLLNRAQRYPELMRAAEAALDRDPGHAEAHYHRGAALIGTNRPAEALTAFREARRLDPGHARAAMVEGQLLIAAGRPRQARGPLEEAVRLDRFPGARAQRISAHRSLARLLVQLGEPEQAREVARTLAEREKGSEEAEALLRELGGQ